MMVVKKHTPDLPSNFLEDVFGAIKPWCWSNKLLTLTKLGLLRMHLMKRLATINLSFSLPPA
jgi:hypothetical protein